MSSMEDTDVREGKAAACRLWRLQDLKDKQEERGVGSRPVCSHSRDCTLLGRLDCKASDGESCPTGAQAQMQECGRGQHGCEEELPVSRITNSLGQDQCCTASLLSEEQLNLTLVS